jgi:hypothetical protein
MDGRFVMAQFPIQSGTVASAADRAAPNTNTAPTTPPQLQRLAAVQDMPQHTRAELPLLLLQEAWIYRDFGTIRALLERGAVSPNSFIYDFEDRGEGSLPILAHACRRGATELVRCLLNHGARPAFWMLAGAFEAGHDDVVELMAKRVDIDTLRGGASLLHSACFRLDVSAVDRLLRLGASVKKRADIGAGVLVLILTSDADPDRQVALLTMLLDAGADIETRFGDLTPLGLACWHNNPAAVSCLLKRGARTDPQLDTTRTVINAICSPSVSAEIFELVVGHEPRLWFSARERIDGLDDEQSRRKIICMHQTRAPLNRPDKRMPRTEPKADTV